MKKNLQKLLVIFQVSTLLISLGICIYGIYTYQNITGTTLILKSIFYLSIVLIFNTGVHEIGHLIGGLISGYKPVLIRVGKHCLLFTDQGLRYGQYSIPGTFGQCLMAPPEVDDPSDYPYYLYTILGPIFNIIGPSVLILIGWILSRSTLLILGVSSLVFGIGLAVVNLVVIDGMPNDGHNLKNLQESKTSRVRMYELLSGVSENINGEPCTDQGIDITSQSIFYFTDMLNLNTAVNQLAYLLSQDKLVETKDSAEYLLLTPSIHPIFKNNIKLYLLETYLKLDEYDKANSLLEDPAFVSALNSNTDPHSISVNILYHLHKNNLKRVGQLMPTLDRFRDKYPFKTDYHRYEDIVKYGINNYEKQKSQNL